MDKEDCIQVLLSTLRQPLWESCDSVTDWDLKNVLWRAGQLLSPEQVAALFADIRRRGLISAREIRSEDRIVSLWKVKIAPTGADWLAQREMAARKPSEAEPRWEAPSGGNEPDGNCGGPDEIPQFDLEGDSQPLAQP